MNVEKFGRSRVRLQILVSSKRQAPSRANGSCQLNMVSNIWDMYLIKVVCAPRTERNIMVLRANMERD